jgi:hypothetical protein
MASHDSPHQVLPARVQLALLPLLQFLGVLLRLHYCSSAERQNLPRACRGRCRKRTTSSAPIKIQILDNAAGAGVAASMIGSCDLRR